MKIYMKNVKSQATGKFKLKPEWNVLYLLGLSKERKGSSQTNMMVTHGTRGLATPKNSVVGFCNTLTQDSKITHLHISSEKQKLRGLWVGDKLKEPALA